MSENNRRADDKLVTKIIKMWPVILSVAGLASAYILKGAKLDATATLAERIAIKVQAVETEQAVQKEMISAIREGNTEMRKDLKELLRRVR